MKNVIGFVLIDAPHSALNNAGIDAGSKTDNTVAVKVIKVGKNTYPYVSAQAWRYWWRETIKNKTNREMSPISREEKTAFTLINPFKYIDDDVFGYMRALEKKLGGTLTRISPLKNSPLISIYNQTPTNDYGVMSRQEGNPVPYEHEFYSVILKGIFSLDITNTGVFGLTNKTGYKNLDENYVEKIKESIKETNSFYEDSQKAYYLPKEERIKRIQDTINALSYLSGGAKQTLHHTDVTPKFIILTIIEGGNNLFMNIVSENISNQHDQKIINFEALKTIINDYKDIILSDIYIGKNEGFLDNLKDDITNLKNSNSKIKIDTVKKTIETFSNDIINYI